MNRHVVIIQNTTLAEHYGLSSYLRNIVKQISAQENIKVSLICCAGKLNKSNVSTSVALREIEGSPYSLKGNANFFWKTFRYLGRLNQETKIDVLHCLYPNSGLAGAVLFKFFHNQTTLIYDLRSPWIDVSIERGSIKYGKKLYRALAYATEYILSFFVDKFIFITEGLYEFYRKKLHLSHKPVAVIPSGIDVQQFHSGKNKDVRSTLGLTKNDVLIGYAGAISSLRKLDEVLEAFSLIPKPHSFKLIMIGDGDDLQRLKSIADEYGIAQNVFFTGRLPYEETVDYINCFDAGICHLPDTFVFRQSYPMKVLEYLAAGIPVLASDIAAHRDIARVFRQIRLYRTASMLSAEILALSGQGQKVPREIYDYSWHSIARAVAKGYG